jgi:hypothetical protein
MKKRARRNHTPAFKAKVALAALKNDRTSVWGPASKGDARSKNFLLG